jgi:hypothetical protein
MDAYAGRTIIDPDRLRSGQKGWGVMRELKIGVVPAVTSFSSFLL